MGLPLGERVDAYCRQRARLLHLIAPSARAAQLREPLSPQLHRNRRKHVDRVRDEVERLSPPSWTGPVRDGSSWCTSWWRSACGRPGPCCVTAWGSAWVRPAR